MHDAGGRLTHFIGVQTDITERRDAEEALRQNVARQHGLLRDMFASVTEGRLTLCGTEDDLPPALTPFAGPIALSPAGEAAMNAVVHAGMGVGQVFAHERVAVQVRVEDSGTGIAVQDLPNATLRRGYTTAGTMGHGFKMILKTVDRVYLLTEGAGTTVVMEQDLAAPPPRW